MEKEMSNDEMDSDSNSEEENNSLLENDSGTEKEGGQDSLRDQSRPMSQRDLMETNQDTDGKRRIVLRKHSLSEFEDVADIKMPFEA